MSLAVIFDIDGTLTATTGVDDECFVEAIHRTFGVAVTDTDWANYPCSTDYGLTCEIVRRARGSLPSAEETGRMQRTFFTLLAEKIAAQPTRCRTVPGAHTLLGALINTDVPVGIASGAWPGSAEIKLGAAKLAIDRFPSTFSHALGDGRPASRPQIIEATLAQLGLQRPGLPPLRPVYVGDGVWDCRAARALGIGFVGVRIDGKTDPLRSAGATRIVRDFEDLEAVLNHIMAAADEAAVV